MRRYVRRGSRGIALIDTTGDYPKLRYVFDVSDTSGRENARRPYLSAIMQTVQLNKQQLEKLNKLRKLAGNEAITFEQQTTCC